MDIPGEGVWSKAYQQKIPKNKRKYTIRISGYGKWNHIVQDDAVPLSDTANEDNDI